MVTTTNTDVNRTPRQHVENHMGKYTGGGSTTTGRGCEGDNAGLLSVV
jgi:hypothetical protein